MIIEFFVGFFTLAFYLAVFLLPVAAITYFLGPTINKRLDYHKRTRQDMTKSDWLVALAIVLFSCYLAVGLGLASVELGSQILEAKYGVSN